MYFVSEAAEIQKARAQKDAGTVAYDVDIETAEEIRANDENKKNNSTGNVAYDMNIESTQSAEEIQANREKKVDDKAKANDAALDMDKAPMQTLMEDPDGEEHGSALLDLRNEGTEDSDDKDDGGPRTSRITPSKDAKAVGGTVPVSDTALFETQPVADTIAVAEIHAVGDTIVVSDTAVSETVAMAETPAVRDTVPVSDTANVSDTLKVSDTVAISDTIAREETARQVFPDDNNAPQVLEDPNQKLDEEATQVIADDATQMMEVKSKPKSPIFKTPVRPAPKNISDSEVATQVVEMPPPSSKPKNKGKGKGKRSLPPIDEQPAQANDATQFVEDAPTLPFPDDPTRVSPNATAQGIPAAKSHQSSEAATQLLNSTQLLNEIPVKAEQAEHIIHIGPDTKIQLRSGITLILYFLSNYSRCGLYCLINSHFVSKHLVHYSSNF